MCLVALTLHAQRYAVLEFDAAKGISITQVDGISEMFATCFNPRGYTEVDRSYINRVLSEQNLQHSAKTESIAVRVGKIMNVSKVVVGKVSMLGGQYQVDVKVVDVETEVSIAKDGATVTGNYREKICELARRVASRIAITQGASVVPAPSAPAAKKRITVEVLYGYLKIFPHELGEFQTEPASVIAQINSQAQHGYNNWRIPTNEELSLLRANNYLGSGEYMTRESKRGIVLLVTDGDDNATIQKKAEEARIIAEKKAEEARLAKERRINELRSQGYVDLGLRSGTWWRNQNEEGGFYTYEQAMNKFGDNLPSKEQFEELESACRWTWNGSGYKVTGPNGNSIVLPAAGHRDCDGNVSGVGSYGIYWSSTPYDSDVAWYLYFNSSSVRMIYNYRCRGISVRLVQD